MANIYYPTDSIILQRTTSGSLFTETILSIHPDVVFYFSGSDLTGFSSSHLNVTSSWSNSSISSSYALTASFALNGGSGGSGSGTSGTSGINGASGTSGTSGVNGANGTSGTSGINGTSGTSGASGTSGTSGMSGSSGTSGNSGTAGTSGATGSPGTSGTSGTSGGGGGSLNTGSSYPITSSWAISSSYSNTSSIVEFNGNRSIKRSGYSGINVGGSDVINFLNNFFFPFLPATVATSGGTTIYETGSSNSLSVISTITLNDELTFGSASVRKNGAVWNTTSSAPPSFTFVDSNLTSSATYITYVQTDNYGSPTVISSNSRIATFVYPYLYGTSSIAGLSGTSLYSAFSRQAVTSGNKTISLVGNSTYIYFAYPTSYPALSSILDPNSFEVISNFEYSSSVSVTSTGLSTNWTTTYRVYRTLLISDPNGNYQFRQ